MNQLQAFLVTVNKIFEKPVGVCNSIGLVVRSRASPRLGQYVAVVVEHGWSPLRLKTVVPSLYTQIEQKCAL